MDRGLSPTEERELVVWCNQNTKHHATLLEMASYWDDVSVLNELSGLFPLEQTKKQGNHLVSIALAASVALITLFSTNALISNSFLPFIPSLNEQALTQTKTLSSPLGEQSNFTLSDGTHIQLNTNSIVEVAYNASSRQLTLVQGEARFDVAKDKSRPFTVTSGEKSFTALGTIFNVQKDDDHDMELMVTEGRVLITKANEAISVLKQALTQSSETPSSNITFGTIVTSGEKAVIEHNSEAPVEKVSLDQVQRDLAWQQGMIIFDGESLSNALTEVSRYTSSRFEIINPKLANMKVSGYFKANDVDGLLASLQSNLNINSQKSINNTILLDLAK